MMLMCELANVKMAHFENVMKVSTSSGLQAGETKNNKLEIDNGQMKNYCCCQL
jgi:hypothetical protein